MVEVINDSPMEKNLKMVSADYMQGKTKLVKNGLHKGLVAFGSARIPMDDKVILECEEISNLCAQRIIEKKKNLSFMTGGGPSFMNAWLKGANQFNLNPDGTRKEEYVVQTSGVCLNLPHETDADRLQNAVESVSYTALTFEARKALLIEYAEALIVFDGGFGTMDELFVALTLMKTHKIPDIPIFLYSSKFWTPIKDLADLFVNRKTITENEKDILHYCDTKEDLLKELYKVIDNKND
ncbi:MAG: TIGR00730 family Rossman fold protein [Rickettsiales bacterium]|nr:MAG: TIGR00730 family Rossman fold protein [Rickettsiales bacterium]